MIPGCETAPAIPPAPVIVELASVRCPDLPEADQRAFAARVARPKADITGSDGRPWVSVNALQEAVDKRDLVIARMARAGANTVAAYEACRSGQPPRPDVKS